MSYVDCLYEIKITEFNIPELIEEIFYEHRVRVIVF